MAKKDTRKIYKGKLRLGINHCQHIDSITEVSKHYWKVYHSYSFTSPCYKSNKMWRMPHALRKTYIGLRTYYLKYFGQVVNVKYHRKYPHIVQIYSNRDMLMMDAFECWFEWIKPLEDISEVTWDDLFKV